ncbi:MAG: prolipoprotein diacylglyceryl transferase [Candidatus Tyrphobacter sp.]
MHQWFSYPQMPVEIPFPFGWHLGPIAGVHFYGISYLIGFLCVYLWVSRPASLKRLGITREQVGDFIFYAVVGVLVGGRALFVIADMLTPVSRGGHPASFYFGDPINFVAVWQGGMAFHGGAIGAIVAIVLFCYKHRPLKPTALADEIVALVPIGIGLTRIVNFINDELWGRVCRPDHPYCMVFPTAPLVGGANLPRYPSQLFESVLDFLTLPILLAVYRTKPRNGVVAWTWFTLYGITRSIAEIWRQPGILVFHVITGGQLLAIPMIVIGAIGIWYCLTRSPSQSAATA